VQAALTALLLGSAFAACTAASPVIAQGRFTGAELSSASRDGPWPMSAFTPPRHARPPSNRFEGRLELGAPFTRAEFHTLRDRFGNNAGAGDAATRLPYFNFAFLQTGDALIPLERGAITSSSAYEFVLEAGRVWDEPGDRGFTRAGIPFALEERNENCMHHGVLTFAFRSDGAISLVAYQIASETCAYFHFDAWGYAQAHYVRTMLSGREGIVRRYRREVARRMPVRPITALALRYHGVDPERFASASEVQPQDLTVYGVVADGVHYVSGCNTRRGAYPFCDALDLPSYSTAKSLAAGLAVMRLAMTYPRITDTRIVDYVPECAAANSWENVTVGNALDMATGHFNSRTSMVDEYADDVIPFYDAEAHAAKIAFSCTHYPRQAAAGELWVYHTTDTYVLGAALAGFYRDRHGIQADMFRGVLGPIWHELALSPSAYVTRRTYDAVRQPFMGYGMTLLRDDVAKFANFLNVDHGRVRGRQLVDARMLDDALHRQASHAAFPAPTDDLVYKNGFWAWNAQQTLGCRTPSWSSLMLGYGGIVIALFPNGVSYYYFSDGDSFKWKKAAIEANRIRPMCQ